MSPRSISIRIPATIITAAKPIMTTDCGSRRPTALPAKVAGIPQAAKTPAMRQLIWC